MLHRVNQNRAINGESYRAGEEIDIDPSDPGWKPWVEGERPVLSRALSGNPGVGSVDAPEATTGPTDEPAQSLSVDCPSPSCAGREDRCGIFSFPPRCTFTHCSAFDATSTQPEGVSAPSDGT